MPGTYPPPTPTYSDPLLTIHRLLASPTQIRRRLRTIADLRFVADQLLTQRFRSSGGAVLYEISEPVYNTAEVTAVSAGAEYPLAATANGTAALASVSKWGQATELTDESIKRRQYPVDEVDRTLRKVLNTVIRKVDRLAIAAIASACTETQAATAAWDQSTATILRDVEYAIGSILDEDMGYNPDSILLSTTRYAELVSDDKVATLRRRETTDNPVYAGVIEKFANLNVVVTSSGNLPSDNVWVLDSRQLGGMADETEVDPGYTVAEMGVQIQTERVPSRDLWKLWGRRITVPVVQEPAAARCITGTAGS